MGKKKDVTHSSEESSKLRIAIVSKDRCKPKKCKHECKKFCPVVKTGKMCIEVSRENKPAFISEPLCVGCGICVKKCPFEAIQIINLPKDLGRETTHRYGPNTFKLHRLPVPRPGAVLGLVGTNGIGKTTALKVLSGKLKPNLGRWENSPDWAEILQYFRGSELQQYFSKILEDRLKSCTKPQYVDQIPKQVGGVVGEILKEKCQRNNVDEMTKILEIDHLLERNVKDLSGGELQRFAIGLCCVLDANVYMFDEPSSYLDVRQRLSASRAIRSMIKDENYIICVEHDLAVLDYLSDFVCCLWGAAGAFGVVSMPSAVREGINVFLSGFLPTENLRFREVSLTFKVSADNDPTTERLHSIEYPYMTKDMGTFHLTVEKGTFANSEIIVMLGQNGTGKTMFIRMLAGLLAPDDENIALPRMHVSYKPQTISPKFQGSVEQLMYSKIRDAYTHPQFITEVVKPMLIDNIKDQEVPHLSGGELQRVAIVIALGKPADVYLIDEPSAYLDVEQRIVAAKVIKRYIMSAKKTAFIVEHDFIMATYLADRVVVYEGQPGVKTRATSPTNLVEGMNRFLKQLDITFRRDPVNYRPRINKMASVKDREQKAVGKFFVLEE